MTRIVVPTDFSETSRNALSYAIDMAAELPGSKLILFNCYESMSRGSDGTPLHTDEGVNKTISMMALENLKNELMGDKDVAVQLMAVEGSLDSSLEKLTQDQQVDMVVMGINGATRMEQIMIGSSTLKIVSLLSCPVLIIPPDARYSRIKTVVYASDMKNVKESTPATQLRKVLSIFRPKLYVANVDVEHYVEITEDYKKEKADMDELLDGFAPDYAFIRLYDFTEAINQFAIDRKADLIITVPRRHNFLSRVFSTSHTEKLAYHTHIPLLAIHE
jgi:nucleotide-binding universal stress UspA family protein